MRIPLFKKAHPCEALTSKWLQISVWLTTMVAGLFGAAFFFTTPFVAQTDTTKVGVKWEETPYLWAGKVLEELKPSVARNILPKYGKLRYIHPSAEACLASPGTVGSSISGRYLIWYELETKEAVEVCLFRVFAALGDQAKIEAWLTSQGFGRKFVVDDTNLAFLYGLEGEQLTSLSMTWLTSEQGALYGVSERQRRKQARRVLQQTVSVAITEGGRVLGVRMTGNSAVWRK